MQIFSAALIREDVRLLAGAARAQAAQLEVVDTPVPGRHDETRD